MARSIATKTNADPLCPPGAMTGGLVLYEIDRVARVAGRDIRLRRREWALLSRLAARAGSVVSKDRLTTEIFATDEPICINAIEVYISRLRRKLAPDGPTIWTVRGHGYMLLSN